MRFRLLPPRRPRQQQKQQHRHEQPDVEATQSVPSERPPNSLKLIVAAPIPNHGSARSVSSLSTGPVHHDQEGGVAEPPPTTALQRQTTGPFPLRSKQRSEPSDESSSGRLATSESSPEISEEDRTIILSRLLGRRPSRLHYDVEIRAQGADDETLEDLLSDSGAEEKKVDGLGRNPIVPASNLLVTLMRSNSKKALHRQSQRAHNNNDDDDDTLEEIMNERSVNRAEERREFSRKVRSGILELLRRSNSKILDQHELWLKTSLQAIEEAKASHPSRRLLKEQMLLAPADSEPYKLIQARDDDFGTKSAESNDDDHCSVAESTASSCAARDVGSEQKQTATAGLENGNEETQVSTVPSPPQEDEMSVAMVEVFVHYLTCCHVLRENELQREPRGLCVHPTAGDVEAALPGIELNLPSQPKGLCVNDCVEDDDSNTYYTDDDTREDSLVLQPKGLVCNAINSELTRSGTNGSLNED